MRHSGDNMRGTATRGAVHELPYKYSTFNLKGLTRALQNFCHDRTHENP